MRAGERRRGLSDALLERLREKAGFGVNDSERSAP
jgi:hypothetical protein